MTILEQIHSTADRCTAEALKREGTTPPCHAGCFHCCRESVISSDEEVRAMLSDLTEEQLKLLRYKTRCWLDIFLANKMDTVAEVPAYESSHGVPAYRSLYLWCPFLADGKCSVYSKRPLACRVHIAYKSNEGCVDDTKRAHQKFALFPDLIEHLCATRIHVLQAGEKVINDHLGILLAKELLGIDHPTAARITFKAQGESLIIEKYEEEKVV